MKRLKLPNSVSLAIFVCGYLSIAAGLSGCAWDYYGRFVLGYPQNMGDHFGQLRICVSRLGHDCNCPSVEEIGAQNS
jgi:hypothetical protein